MNYSEETINRVKELPMADVAERLGVRRARGANTKYHCFNHTAHAHGDRNPSLSIHQEGGIDLFKCFGCGLGGTNVDLVMKCQNVDFKEAVEWLANTFGIELERGSRKRAKRNERVVNFDRPSPYQRKKPELRLTGYNYDLPAETQEIYQDLYDVATEMSEQNTPELAKWWRERGFSDETAKEYGWRVITPEIWREVLECYEYPLLAKAGLVSENRAELGDFMKRYDTHNVITPYFDHAKRNDVDERKVLYIRFRTLDPTKNAKYLSPTGTKPVIYGLNNIADWINYRFCPDPTPNVKAVIEVMGTCERLNLTPPLFVSESETDSMAIKEMARLQGQQVYSVSLSGGQKNPESLLVLELAEAVKCMKGEDVNINIITDRDPTGETFFNAVATALYRVGFNEKRLVKWQRWDKRAKDPNEHLQMYVRQKNRTTEQPNGLHSVNNAKNN